jgi:hypothetical protein
MLCGKPSSLSAMSLRARIRGRDGEWYGVEDEIPGGFAPCVTAWGVLETWEGK